MPHTDQWTIAEFLYSKLNVSSITTLATGGVHRSFVPPTTSLPYVTITPVGGGEDLMVVGQTRIWYRGFWDVVAVGKELQADVVDQIARVIDDLLHRASGSVTDGIVHTCTQTIPIFFHEQNEGINYFYSGGSYEVAARAI